MSKIFTSARIFRTSLESRLQNESKETGESLQRIRRRVAFDRLLVRLQKDSMDSIFVLKGGYAMELRLASKARVTKDIDITCTIRKKETDNDIVLERLRELAAYDLGDYFTFSIGDARQDLEGPPYGGARYPVIVKIADRLFIQFHLDVGLDAIGSHTELLFPKNRLSHIGIPDLPIRTISIEQQFAEKIHAYTVPRDTANSRVKDLIDLVLLPTIKPLNMLVAKNSLLSVFHIHNTHALPVALEPPADTWKEPFAVMARECGLDLSVEEAFAQVSALYLDIVR